MNVIIPVEKNEHHHTEIPSQWRNTLFEIVDAFKDGDFSLSRGVKRVNAISTSDAEGFAENVASYGAQLTTLPEATWKTSVCQWMRSYWDVLVDLYTIEEGASDLVMFVRVREKDDDFVFEVMSIHVP